jgi:uncharacterized protein YukJ
MELPRKGVARSVKSKLSRRSLPRGRFPGSPHHVQQLVGSDGTDLKVLFEITELGREYLKLRDNTSPS